MFHSQNQTSNPPQIEELCKYSSLYRWLGSLPCVPQVPGFGSFFFLSLANIPACPTDAPMPAEQCSLNNCCISNSSFLLLSSFHKIERLYDSKTTHEFSVCLFVDVRSVIFLPYTAGLVLAPVGRDRIAPWLTARF